MKRDVSEPGTNGDQLTQQAVKTHMTASGVGNMKPGLRAKAPTKQ